MASRIRKLSLLEISQVAAGEVIEGPFSIVRECVDNAIDAQASSVSITMQQGGKSKLVIKDNGKGMNKEEVALCALPNTTSKLEKNQFHAIKYRGFRGEALPSIGAVSKMKISSAMDNEGGWSLEVRGGRVSPLAPVARDRGCTVSVEDLFYNLPARRRFLRSDATESHKVLNVVKSLGLSAPSIAFRVQSGKREVLTLPTVPYTQGDNFAFAKASVKRYDTLMNGQFLPNAVPVAVKREPFSLYGAVGVPTFHGSDTRCQHVLVNKRPIRDRLLAQILRTAYQGIVGQGKVCPVLLALFLPLEEVDVNVHPAKQELRFRNPQGVFHFIVQSLISVLKSAPLISPTNLSQEAVTRLRSPTTTMPQAVAKALPASLRPSALGSSSKSRHLSTSVVTRALKTLAPLPPVTKEILGPSLPLGTALAQIHTTYIIAQKPDGIVFIDQHAAHERIVLETLKQQLEKGGIQQQVLAVPLVVQLSLEDKEALVNQVLSLKEQGLLLEAFGEEAVVVRAFPAVLESCDMEALVKRLASELVLWGSKTGLAAEIQQLLSSIACHHSVRAGRKLSLEEMNALLRKMEKTVLAGQCNHGRPTFVELKLSDIHQIFDRK